jgi:pyruvate formate lyase activating enzyme
MTKNTEGKIASENPGPDKSKGLIFDIQGQSVNDGPGTRTTVFMVGCPLRCLWCANPESQLSKLQMLYIESNCVLAKDCIEACPYDAITIKGSKLSHDINFCRKCKTVDCVEACLHDAKKISGDHYTVDQLFDILQRDRSYWGDDGGVTFSGGEMLNQHEFILAVMKKCREHAIHVAVETSSFAKTEVYLEIMEYVDWAFLDIKHMDSAVHKKVTGVPNELILKNIEALAKKPDYNGYLVPRIPVIPGYNASKENIRATAEFVKKVGLEVIHLLPYHNLGESKYDELNWGYPLADVESPSQEYMEDLSNIVKEYGLYCYVGYDTPF